MWQYILGILLLRRLGLARPLRYFFLFALALLTIIVLIYTANLFLTLEQRTSAAHVHAHSSH
jgi:hypothetical protein